MRLDRRHGPHVVDALLNALAQRHRLVDSRNDNEHLARVHHRLDSHRQRHLWHLAQVVVEEARVCDDSIVRQRFYASARRQGGPWLVERDVAVRPDATQEQLDASVRLDLGLIGVALGLKIVSVPVEYVDVFRVHVDMFKKVLVHELMVRLGVVLGDANVLVHVEGDDVRERDSPCLVQLHETGVGALWRGSRGQAEHERALCRRREIINADHHVVRDPLGDLPVAAGRIGTKAGDRGRQGGNKKEKDTILVSRKHNSRQNT